MKERLTGAIILVALIVLLVPEMLHGPIRPPAPQARGSESAAEEPPLKSVTISLADDAHGGSAAPQPQTPAPVAPAAEPARAVAESPPSTGTPQPAPAPAASPPTRPVPRAAAPAAAAPAAAAAASAGGAGFVVRLGSFIDRKNAERLAQQVRSRGFQVTVSSSISRSGRTRGKLLYRVQVGPAHDRAGAEQLLAQLHASGHNGPIVPQ